VVGPPSGAESGVNEDIKDPDGSKAAAALAEVVSLDSASAIPILRSAVSTIPRLSRARLVCAFGLLFERSSDSSKVLFVLDLLWRTPDHSTDFHQFLLRLLETVIASVIFDTTRSLAKLSDFRADPTMRSSLSSFSTA
jgi:hypothetical protein